MSYKNRFGNKPDSSRKESSFGKKTDYSSHSNRFDLLNQTDSKPDEQTYSSRSKRDKRDVSKSSSKGDDSRRFEDSKDDDGFKPIRKNHSGERKSDKRSKIRTSDSDSYSSYRSSKTEKTAASSDKPIEKKELPKGVFTINGPGYFKRKLMVDKVNNGIKMSTIINIERLYNEASPDIQRFIKQTEIDELNLVVWNCVNEIETAHIHIEFDEHESDFMNPSEDEPADLLISKSKFMCMMSKILFYQNCIDYISNSISINLPDYPSERQETLNHVGTIGFAIHNDTPDSGIKTYELFHIIVFNMLNLFIHGYAGKAFCFKISPQGNRFNIEIRYDLDEFEDVYDAIKHIRLIASSYYNKIFNHVICYGCKQEGQRKPFMKYSFDGYVAKKKTTDETETKEEVKKEEDNE